MIFGPKWWELIGFVGDFCQQKRKWWNLLQIILCDKPTGFSSLRSFFFRDSERFVRLIDIRHIRMQQKQAKRIPYEVSTHQRCGIRVDPFFLPSRFVTEDGWPLQDVGEAGLCRVGRESARF